MKRTCILTLSHSISRIVLWAIGYVCAPHLCAQDTLSPPLLSGNISLSADYYSLRTDPAPFLAPRRPANLYRLLASTNFHYGIIELPLTLVLSSQQTNISTGFAPEQSLQQFLQNPLNIIAIEPRVGWFQAHLGSYTPRYSGLSVGDVQIFGAGADINPGKLIMSAFYGVAQRAIEPTFPVTSFNLAGAYQRTMMGAQLGSRIGGNGKITVQTVYALDDTNSVTTAPQGITPQEHLVSSVAAAIDIDSSIVFDTEVAGNITTRNLRSKLYEDADYAAYSPLTVRYSTRLDYAATAGLALNFGTWNLRTAAKYIGEGFISPGFPYMQPDRLELTAQPTLRLMDNALQLFGTVGYRLNNLLSTQTETLKQLLLAANGSWFINEEWSLSISFSNFGVRNTARNDTLRIENVSRSFSLSPVYNFATSIGRHTISLTGGVDSFEDFNLFSGTLTTNNTTSGFLNYALALLSIPISAYSGLSYVQNDVPVAGFTTLSLNIGANYTLRSLGLTPGMRCTLSSTEYRAGGSNTQFLIGFSCGYALSAATTLSLSANMNSYSFSTNSSYTESTVQAMVSTRF